jgi:hypothetical protein
MSIGCLLNLLKLAGCSKRRFSKPGGRNGTASGCIGEDYQEFLKIASADDISKLRTLPVKTPFEPSETASKPNRAPPGRTGSGWRRDAPVPLESLEAGLGFKVPTLIGSIWKRTNSFR